MDSQSNNFKMYLYISMFFAFNISRSLNQIPVLHVWIIWWNVLDKLSFGINSQKSVCNVIFMSSYINLKLLIYFGPYRFSEQRCMISIYSYVYVYAYIHKFSIIWHNKQDTLFSKYPKNKNNDPAFIFWCRIDVLFYNQGL